MARSTFATSKISTNPDGQLTTTFAVVAEPSPKCSLRSEEEVKLDWLRTGCTCLWPPNSTVTRAPMAARLERVPASVTSTQLLPGFTLLRRKLGGSLRFQITIWPTPPLSKHH